jgi:ankyrin repeat protein
LINTGADTNLQNKAGCTALHMAARDDREEFIRLLIGVEDMNPNIQDNVRSELRLIEITFIIET